jgi:hypothetical protein
MSMDLLLEGEEKPLLEELMKLCLEYDKTFPVDFSLYCWFPLVDSRM